MNFDCTYDNFGASLTINSEYKGWNLREAILYTTKHIRETTDKNLVLLHSGGSDSQLISWAFRHMNVPVKRVHIRYFYKGVLINFYENQNIIEDDVIVYDVDVEEYERSQEYMDILNKLPYHVYLALQTYYPDQDPENDVLIRAGQTIPIAKRKNGFLEWDQSAATILISYMYRSECINFFQHNPIIEGVFFIDDIVQKTLDEMPPGTRWEDVGGKTSLYKHYFPELGDLIIPKQTICLWDGFKHLVLDRGNGIYKKYDGSPLDSYHQRTYFRESLEKIQNIIRDSGKITFKVKWNYDGNYWTDSKYIEE